MFHALHIAHVRNSLVPLQYERRDYLAFTLLHAMVRNRIAQRPITAREVVADSTMRQIQFARNSPRCNGLIRTPQPQTGFQYPRLSVVHRSTSMRIANIDNPTRYKMQMKRMVAFPPIQRYLPICK